MSVQSKVLFFILGVTAAFSGTSYLAQRWIMLPGFEEVERNAALDDVSRCVHALRRDAEFLSSSANDYGAWDDTYQFIEDVNEQYQSENLIPETFENLHLDLLMFVRTDGTMVWGEVRGDEGKNVLIDASDVLEAIARSDHPLVSHARPDSTISGVLTTSRGPMLVGSAAITTSNREGAVRGAVIMARFVTDSYDTELSEITRVAVAFYPVDAIPETESSAMSRLRNGDSRWIDSERRETLRSYALVQDLFDNPALLLRADLPRAISQRGHAAAGVAAATSIVGGAALILVMWFVLARMIVRPLNRVTAHAVRVGAETDPAARLNMIGRDEIGVLARAFDGMVDRLAKSRAQMLDMAHNAGKAEVATNVLHNVGNVLNSVNVSAGVVSDKLRHSEVGTVALAAQTMLDHKDDIGDFLARDERGRQLPAFLGELAGQLNREQEAMLAEMKTLMDALEHIRHVVDLQQEHSIHQAVLEWIAPSVVIEQALSLSAESLARHKIRVEREFQAVEPVRLDKHRILQILVNLLTNAVQALKAAGREDAKIVVKLHREQAADGDRLRLRIEDNGVGIDPENLERVFSFGFSTRPGGHGVGLHGAANMAGEMGGSLSAESDGPSRGAAFMLTIPLSRERVHA